MENISEAERLVNYNWPSMVRASKWAQLLHAPTFGYCYSNRTSERGKGVNEMKNLNIPRFRGKLPEGSLLSRGPSCRDHIMELWILKLRS